MSPCLNYFDAEYIKQNAGLDEAQTGIKTAKRNIINFKYADDTTLMAEREEELKSLLINLKEESEKAGLKPNIQKTKIIWSHHFMGKKWKVTDFIFLGFKIIADGDCSHEIKRCLLLAGKAMTNIDSMLKKAETSLCRQRSI